MLSLVEDVQSDYPNEDDALNVAEALGEIFERNLLRDHVIPRIHDCDELNWLKANSVPFAIKSSIDQFAVGFYLRIQISKEAHRTAWRKWHDQ